MQILINLIGGAGPEMKLIYCILLSVNHQEEMFKIREKRFGFRVPCIKVATDAVVSYENSIVRVVRGSVLLYRFPGIRVFHVFNRAEGYLEFYGSAGGRVFPGFGMLLPQQTMLTIFGRL